MKTLIISLLLLLCAPVYSNFNQIEELADTVSEVEVLIETRAFLRELNEQRDNGIKIDEDAVLKVEAKVERIARSGCDCEEEYVNDILRSQAYALVAGINGILAKGSYDIGKGRKSYRALEKARELDPTNTDAVKGQAVALNMILSKSWVVRKLAATALGINLRDAQKELIEDLRGFGDRADLQKLADQLEDKL